MGLVEELELVAAEAAPLGDGARLVAVLVAEAAQGVRVYVCAFEAADGARSWLVVDRAGDRSTDRREVRAAVSIAALCELAADSAGGGDLEELRAQLVGAADDRAARGDRGGGGGGARARADVGAPPRIASPARSTRSAAARRLEQALGDGALAFAAAMKLAQGA